MTVKYSITCLIPQAQGEKFCDEVNRAWNYIYRKWSNGYEIPHRITQETNYTEVGLDWFYCTNVFTNRKSSKKVYNFTILNNFYIILIFFPMNKHLSDLADLGGMEAVDEDLLNDVEAGLHVLGFLNIKQELRANQ